MSSSPSTENTPRQRLLDFRSGGGVLLLAALLALGVAVWRGIAMVQTYSHRAIGDGVTLDSYKFDLSTLLVPRERLQPIGRGLPKNALPALTNPETAAAADMPEHQKLNDVRKLVSDDRVIGVTINGQSRAYPLWIMNWHELANDTLGGQPILVTYNGICDSVVVFDRRVAGETLEFGFSGLVCNGNLAFYDRRPDGVGESLWCQLQFRAISGPAAAKAETLRRIPATLTTWAQWHAQHPETSVLLPDPARAERYKENPYDPYFRSDKLRFTVSPLPPTEDPPLKTPVVAVPEGDGWKVVKPEAFAAKPESPEGPAVYGFWFAWHAHHPETPAP